MRRKRFMRAVKRNLALWMLALNSMSEEAKRDSIEMYPEDSEFACWWWNDIYSETGGRGWEWALDLSKEKR